jgi:siroheme synthase-like protein
MMLDVTERLVVIIGGGTVAARKARGLIEAGATRIRVVSPVFVPELPEGVQRITAAYQPAHLDGAQLAFAATDSADVNEAVVREARARGILVSRADGDDQQPADFATPAKFVQGQIVVTVSAGSAALSAKVRDRLADRFDVEWSQMAEAMQLLRPMIRNNASIPTARRAEIFRALATDEAIDQLAAGGRPTLIRWLRDRYPELSQIGSDVLPNA